MLKILGQPKYMPTRMAVKKKQNYYDDISAETFEKTKIDLLSYLQENNDVIVRDHCHLTGRFRGAAHQNCNPQYRKNCKIPCFFHNFTGYDSHHVMKALEGFDIEKIRREKPRVLAKSLEKLTSMQLGNLELKDSYQLLNWGLDRLVENLKEEGKKKISLYRKHSL